MSRESPVMRRLALLLAIALMGAPAAAAPCGGTVPCEVEGGYYLAAPPPDWDGSSPLPLVVYFHGWNASPEGTFRRRSRTCGRACCPGSARPERSRRH